jgi:hypothetical protein
MGRIKSYLVAYHYHLLQRIKMYVNHVPMSFHVTAPLFIYYLFFILFFFAFIGMMNLNLSMKLFK